MCVWKFSALETWVELFSSSGIYEIVIESDVEKVLRCYERRKFHLKPDKLLLELLANDANKC